MINFTSEQKKAIYNITMLMMMIDGHVAPQEGVYWKKVGSILDMSDSEKQSAAQMDKNAAASVLRMMPAANKIAAIKIFAKMMEADGEIDAREAKLLEKLFDVMDCTAAANTLGEDELNRIINSFS